MKPIKKIAYGGMILGMSLMLLGGCGSKDEPKETTASSAQTESSKESKSKDDEKSPVSLQHPFNDGYPMYVADNDDSNRRVQAIIVPYADTDNKIKVTTYDNGNKDKTYIVEYKVQAIDKGTDTKPAVYRYSFYDNENHEWKYYDAGYVSDSDIKGQVFIQLVNIDKSRIKDGHVNDYSADELKKQFDKYPCAELYDNSKYVTMK